MMAKMRRDEDAMTYNPAWYDPAMPRRDDCVLGRIIDRGAAEHPDRILVRFENGATWTWAEALGHARRAAAGLRELGVGKGDRVLVWAPNGPELLKSWFATAILGAVYSPINIAYRGGLLEHVIANSGARVMIAHAGLVDRLDAVSIGRIEHLFVAGDAAPVVNHEITVQAFDTLDADDGALPEDCGVEPWDTHSIIYTSGTTGPSKGVLCSGLHFYTVGVSAVGFIDAGETVMVNMPLFHIGAAGGVYGTLARRGTIALFDSFSTNGFWDQVRETNAVATCGMVGSMTTFLAKIPPSSRDLDNPLRQVLVAPVNDVTIGLARRHGFDYTTGYGMTEAPIPLIAEVNTTVQGYCGRPRSGIECRIVDAHDMPVPDGEVGELIIRADLPWSMNHGYHEDPAATAEAWRNGWFHTGDAFRRDAEGRYYFIDRMKDTIRRRGENISSLEVETQVLAHPDVKDVAAIRADSEYGEHEVMIVVEPHPDRTIDPADLTAFLEPRMAHFMVPRYVRFMAALPKTPTNKVRKPFLREEGVTADTWDREAAGIVIKRQKLA
jgi:crotonobetaine/carnitine-CoA ligase